MPAQTTITLGEGSLTLNPLGKVGNIASYSDDSAVSVAVEPMLTISSVRPSKTSKLYKVRMKLSVPVSALDTLGDPNGVKIREASADLTFLFHETATDVEKQFMLDSLNQLISNADVAAVITEGKSIY